MGAKNMRMLCAFLLFIISATAEATEISAGSGVVIGTQGEILTNAHVVEACAEINVRFPTGNSERGVLLARDEKNDLAAIRAKEKTSPWIRVPQTQSPPSTSIPATSVATFRDGPVRAGDAVVALGYPLSGLLASTANLSVGNVSALAGVGDDSRYLQISAPVQPGNKWPCNWNCDSEAERGARCKIHRRYSAERELRAQGGRGSNVFGQQRHPLSDSAFGTATIASGRGR
jgi:S1-C subfamily serine protease